MTYTAFRPNLNLIHTKTPKRPYQHLQMLKVILCYVTIKVFLNRPLTHNEAVVSTITAVVQTAVGLEQEEATGSVVIIGGNARHPQTLPLSQQLLLTREAPVVRAGLKAGATGGHTT